MPQNGIFEVHEKGNKHKFKVKQFIIYFKIIYIVTILKTNEKEAKKWYTILKNLDFTSMLFKSN